MLIWLNYLVIQQHFFQHLTMNSDSILILLFLNIPGGALAITFVYTWLISFYLYHPILSGTVVTVQSIHESTYQRIGKVVISLPFLIIIKDQATNLSIWYWPSHICLSELSMDPTVNLSQQTLLQQDYIQQPEAAYLGWYVKHTLYMFLDSELYFYRHV